MARHLGAVAVCRNTGCSSRGGHKASARVKLGATHWSLGAALHVHQPRKNVWGFFGAG